MKNVQYRKTCEDNVQVGLFIVYILQFSRPVGIFMDFVNKEVCAVVFHKLVGEIDQGVVGEVNVVGTHIQVFSIALLFFDALEQ